MDFAEVSAGFEAAAGVFDEGGIEAGHVGDLFDHGVGGGLVGVPLMRVVAYSPSGVVDDRLHGFVA